MTLILGALATIGIAAFGTLCCKSRSIMEGDAYGMQQHSKLLESVETIFMENGMQKIFCIKGLLERNVVWKTLSYI